MCYWLNEQWVRVKISTWILFFSFTGNYQKALETYKDIHRKFPENVECNSSYLLFNFQQNSWPTPDDPLSEGRKDKKQKYVCFSRPAFFGEAVHRHGIERSPRIRHQAEEGGEDEGDQRTGLSLQAFTFGLILIHTLGPLWKLSQLSSLVLEHVGCSFTFAVCL